MVHMCIQMRTQVHDNHEFLQCMHSHVQCSSGIQVAMLALVATENYVTMAPRAPAVSFRPNDQRQFAIRGSSSVGYGPPCKEESLKEDMTRWHRPSRRATSLALRRESAGHGVENTHTHTSFILSCHRRLR